MWLSLVVLFEHYVYSFLALTACNGYITKSHTIIGMWLSLVEHYVRDVGAAGSNPVIPTK